MGSIPPLPICPACGDTVQLPKEAVRLTGIIGHQNCPPFEYRSLSYYHRHGGRRDVYDAKGNKNNG